MIRVWIGTMNARITQAKRNFLPGKLNLAKPYAIKEQESTCPREPIAVTRKEFHAYLVGFIKFHATAKFSNLICVGSHLTEELLRSALDINEFDIMYKNGYRKINASPIISAYMKTFRISFFTPVTVAYFCRNKFTRRFKLALIESTSGLFFDCKDPVLVFVTLLHLLHFVGMHITFHQSEHRRYYYSDKDEINPA